MLLHLLADRVLKSVERLGLSLLGELGVIGENAAAEALERDRIDGLLALETLGSGLLIELRLNTLLRLTGLHTLERVENLGEEASLFDLGPEALAGSDDLGLGIELENRLAADRAGVVNLNEIALSYRIALLGVLVRRVRGAETGDLVIDVRILDGNVVARELKTLVGGKLKDGLHFNDSRERTALGVERHILNIGDGDIVELLSLDGFGDIALIHHALGLLLKTVGELLADKLYGNLTGTETGELRLADESLFDILDNGLHLVGIERNIKLNLALFEFFYFGFHYPFSPCLKIVSVYFIIFPWKLGKKLHSPDNRVKFFQCMGEELFPSCA